ncbi:hypothetical protein KAR91_05260 [Candidatus Pacearchaeota archaeon]|nr:hypothetical protein [Candidatus Pacearchaeota archaeon]
MNWNQHLTVCTEVIANIPDDDTGARVIGVHNGLIIALLKEPRGGDWHKITKITPFDIKKGLRGEHWNIIGVKIRHLVRKGVLI